ncbi:MAG TPA: nitrate- and nitrite sensing domain-containing protein, partial [Polyangia bacterium]|nr:nitrate- and nitrite sensing domain-containing protein [Polyangia bacterium]
MFLSRPDAASILRFCLGADDSGKVAERADGTCTVTITLCRSSYEVTVFEGATFDEALRRAAAAGLLKAACIDKQIAFLARRAAAAGAGGETEEPAPALPAEVAGHASPATTQFAEMTNVISALLHETQRERGISTLFVGSHGLLFGNELCAQWRRTDQQRAALREVACDAVAGAPPAVQRRMERAQGLLASVGIIRGEIEERAASAARVIEVYSAVNAELLGAIDAFMVAAVIGAQRSSALACVCLQYAKEKTGIERAQLADAFSEDRFAQGQRLSVAALIAAQSSYLHIFSAGAPRAAEQLLRRTLASPAAAEVKRMESVVFTDCDRGFGIDASAWFTTMSRKIDMLA